MGLELAVGGEDLSGGEEWVVISVQLQLYQLYQG